MICFQFNLSKCIIKCTTLSATLDVKYSCKYLNIQIHNYLNVLTNSRASRVTDLFHPFRRDPALLKTSIIWLTRRSPVFEFKVLWSINQYGLCLMQRHWKTKSPCTGQTGQLHWEVHQQRTQQNCLVTTMP